MSSMTGRTAMLADIPIIPNIVNDVIDSTTGWAWDKVTQGIGSWVLGAVGQLVDGCLNFLKTEARPNVQAAWFSGAGSPYATVRNLAGLLLLGFVFLAIIQGLIAGDAAGMVRRVAADLPAAVLGMVATVAVVAKLLELTDSLSTGVLQQSDGQALHFVSGFGASITGSTQGFAAVIVGLVAVLAALMLWIELMIRSVLVYLLVALSPLGFAAMVWPAARGVLRRMLELLLAIVISKLVVCIALSIGVAALAGAGTAAGPNAGVGDVAAQGLGTLFTGTAILALAAFSPFLVLRLMPVAEAALVAQGISRGPLRTAQATASNVYHVQSMSRLAGGSSSVGSGASTGWISGAKPAGAVLGPAGVATVAATKTAGAAARRARESVDQASGPTPGGSTAGASSEAAQRPRPSRSPEREGPSPKRDRS
jgi:hypothetical protein